MSFWKDERAQGSIEMLILVAGAIIVVSIVGVILKRTASQAAERAGEEVTAATTG